MIKPILFNTDMVRALLEGRKTVTRRVVKPQPIGRLVPELPGGCWPGYFAEEGTPRVVRPPYRPDGILYVRETWCWCYCWDCGMDTEEGCADEAADKFYNSQKEEWGCYGYRASFKKGEVPFGDGWRPSIHMPREAARIFLRVTDVRVERLQDIDNDGCMAEGICSWSKDGKLYKYYLADEEEDYPACDWSECPRTPQAAMRRIWDSTIKFADRALYGWVANPWVWVIEFERCEKPEEED